jgi:uncharacterized protein (DUF2235 family)
MGKNIVVCCDGTANEFAKNNTNVVKLYYALNQDPTKQITYYHPGLGTMEPAGALTTAARRLTKLLGMAMGYGLSNDIRDLYVFLMEHFTENDKIYLFGFSRGAYTVRAVASLLRMYGLIRQGNGPLVPYAIRMMNAIDRASNNDAKDRVAISEYFELANDFKRTMTSVECKPWFVGVWDTVSSVGWVENPLKLPYIANNPDIRTGRHAVAIDERRAFFRSHLWRRPPDLTKPWGPQDVMQVWFPGVHCDVGGGYPESESGLSKIALEWMLEEAKAEGLLTDQKREAEVFGRGQSQRFVAPNPNAIAHESLNGAWHIAEVIPKKHFDRAKNRTRREMNRWRRRTVPAGALVHESAWLRGNDYSKRLPTGCVPVKTTSISIATPPTTAGQNRSDTI